MSSARFRVLILTSLLSLFVTAMTAYAQETSTLKFPEEVLKTKRARLAFEIGHNATPTSYAMRGRTWTAGHYGVGYAFSDAFFIATSPWILTSYNTLNLNAKYIKPVTSTVRAGFFASYFQSYERTPFLQCFAEWACKPGQSIGGHYETHSGRYLIGEGFYQFENRFRFEAATMQALFGFDIGRTTIHTALKYSYFFNDDHPYSLRMDPGDDAIRGQIDATVLVEHRLAERVRVNYEIGSLGLNDIEPYLHMGASIAIVFPKWLVQLGGSMSGRFGRFGTDDFWTPGTSDGRQHTSAEGKVYYDRYLTSAVHPEVQAQYFF